MVVNFRARRISRGARKLARIPTLKKKKKEALSIVMLQYSCFLWGVWSYYHSLIQWKIPWLVQRKKVDWKLIINKFSIVGLGPVCLQESSFLLESEFRGKWIPGKWIPGKYFPMFGSVMENKLENTFQCLVMLWKMSWKITY